MENNQYSFNEDNAVKFIRAELPESIREKYDDDKILSIVYIIWDYYEDNEYISLNYIDTEEEQLDVDDLVKYVKKEVKNDQELIMDSKDVELIVKAELDYEESLEDFI